jgi:hypothetical protein
MNSEPITAGMLPRISDSVIYAISECARGSAQSSPLVRA